MHRAPTQAPMSTSGTTTAGAHPQLRVRSRVREARPHVADTLGPAGINGSRSQYRCPDSRVEQQAGGQRDHRQRETRTCHGTRPWNRRTYAVAKIDCDVVNHDSRYDRGPCPRARPCVARNRLAAEVRNRLPSSGFPLLHRCPPHWDISTSRPRRRYKCGGRRSRCDRHRLRGVDTLREHGEGSTIGPTRGSIFRGMHVDANENRDRRPCSRDAGC